MLFLAAGAADQLGVGQLFIGLLQLVSQELILSFLPFQLKHAFLKEIFSFFIVVELFGSAADLRDLFF